MIGLSMSPLSGRERLWDIQSHLAAEQTKRPHLPVLPGCATNRPLDPIKVKRKTTRIMSKRSNHDVLSMRINRLLMGFSYHEEPIEPNIES